MNSLNHYNTIQMCEYFYDHKTRATCAQTTHEYYQSTLTFAVASAQNHDVPIYGVIPKSSTVSSDTKTEYIRCCGVLFSECICMI